MKLLAIAEEGTWLILVIDTRSWLTYGWIWMAWFSVLQSIERFETYSSGHPWTDMMHLDLLRDAKFLKHFPYLLGPHQETQVPVSTLLLVCHYVHSKKYKHVWCKVFSRCLQMNMQWTWYFQFDQLRKKKPCPFCEASLSEVAVLILDHCLSQRDIWHLHTAMMQEL